MSNNITIELCEEDRKRLDRLTEALEKSANRVEVVNVSNQVEAAPTPTTTPTEEKQAPTPTEEKAEPVQTPDTPAQEATPEEAPKETPKPTVTLSQIQQKVVQLVTSNGGVKKAAVREIISAYAAKVSDLPAEKWDEVWAKLTALESEA